MERNRTLDPTHCKHAFLHLNCTENLQLKAFDSRSSFTVSKTTPP